MRLCLCQWIYYVNETISIHSSHLIHACNDPKFPLHCFRVVFSPLVFNVHVRQIKFYFGMVFALSAVCILRFTLFHSSYFLCVFHLVVSLMWKFFEVSICIVYFFVAAYIKQVNAHRIFRKFL